MEQPISTEKRQDTAANPLLVLILLGVAALYMTVMLFVGTRGFNNFMFKFFELTPYAALIVGLILFPRKEKNLIFAIGFFALAFYTMISCFSSLFNPRFGYAIIAFLLLGICFAGYGAIGLSYFFAKEKFYTLKTLGAIACVGISFVMMIINCFVLKGTWPVQILSFLFCTVPTCAAAILYTPFKK